MMKSLRVAASGTFYFIRDNTSYNKCRINVVTAICQWRVRPWKDDSTQILAGLISVTSGQFWFACVILEASPNALPKLEEGIYERS
jgi:hypothetical protein